MATMIMPRLGETVTEGTVTKWYKAEGEEVQKDEPILEISTDKVDTEIPSPASGVLTKILVAVDQTVPVETELAVIEEKVVTPVSEAPSPKVKSEKKVSDMPSKTPVKKTGLVLSPLVRRLANENNIDPNQISGTGAGGRVTKNDILKYLAEGKAGKPTTPTPETETVVSTGNGERRVPLSNMRKAIAEHMVRSSHVSAHVTTVAEVNMHNIALLRERVKDDFKKKEGFSLTFMPFVAKATIDALLKHPEMNSSLDGEEIVYKDSVNLGIAVALPDGLIVPVIKRAEDMSLVGLAKAINALAIHARDKSLKPDDVHDGTFTITNPGGYGSLIQTPIINQPQVGILSLEKIEKRPVVIDDAIAIRWMVYLPLSYDHRVLDGATATTFLSDIKKNLEDFDFSKELGI